MSVGDTEKAFLEAAVSDGLRLERAVVPFINQRGHLGLPDAARDVRSVMAKIFRALGGDESAQGGKRRTPLRGDFVDPRTGTFIEVDEVQHFTSFRSQALSLYPKGTPLGFEIDEYMTLCEELAHRAEKHWPHKSAVGFGPGGRQRQRAYHDALRDLAAPACGRPPVIRVPALDGDGAAAYLRHRDRVRGLLDIAPGLG